MKADERIVADEGDIEEEERHEPVMALLHDLVRKHGGRRGAAGVLWGCCGSTGGPWPRAWTAEGCRGG